MTQPDHEDVDATRLHLECVRADVEALLDDWKVSKQDKIDKIMKMYKDLSEAPCFDVEVCGARIAVRRVSAFGLEIAVDANDRASAVLFPDGAIVITSGV